MGILADERGPGPGRGARGAVWDTAPPGLGQSAHPEQIGQLRGVFLMQVERTVAPVMTAEELSGWLHLT